MKTIILKVLEFSELNPEAKEIAIEQIRNNYYEYNDFSDFVLDDDYLLNPDEFNRAGFEVIMKETCKKIFYDCQAGYLDITEAILIKDHEKFLSFLGIPKEIHDKILVSFYKYGNSSTKVQFNENDMDYTFTEAEENILSEAEENFQSYLQDILIKINNDYEYHFSDAAIIEDIEANEIEFLETGKQLYHV